MGGGKGKGKKETTEKIEACVLNDKMLHNSIFLHIISHKLFLLNDFCLVNSFFELMLLISSNKSSQYPLGMKIITLYSILVWLLQSVLGVIVNEGKIRKT